MEEVSLEIKAKSVEEAIAKGLAELGKSRDEVNIEVLDRGSSGLFGIGAREARVRISFAQPPVERLDLVAQETLRELLAKMGIEAQVSVRREAPDVKNAPPLTLDVNGDNLGILIGRRGKTLDALQFITRFIVSRKLQRWVPLVIDVEGYKMRREKALRELAQRAAERAIMEQQPLALRPMPPNERRVIHLALRDNPYVTTKSVGQGDKRRVTILPKK